MNLKEIQNAVKYTSLPEIDFKYQKIVSFSQFATYTKCPHQWYMVNIKKIVPEEPNIHFVFGTALHNVLEHYFKIMYEESGTKADKENLEMIFEQKFSEEYQKHYDKYKVHFSSASEMGEFYTDGIEILKWLKKNRNKYFTLKKTYLIGIELPLSIEVKKNVILKSLLDVVLYDETLNKIKIIDFKSSTKGWGDREKKDESKYPQLILYKEYFSKQYNINADLIDIEYVILKRKIWENSDYPQKRIQIFSPTSGKNSRNKLIKNFQEFLNNCFDENGKIIEKEYEMKPSTNSCKWCPLTKEHCKHSLK